MTITDSEMDAIDQRIAVEIFECKIVPCSFSRSYWQRPSGGMLDYTDRWMPTRCIEQAWQVLEKIEMPFGHDWVITGPSEDFWECKIEDEYGKELSMKTAETAPLAISLAALKTLEEK